ncbi:MAG TPA: hypothetical protein VK928_00055 [Longimicrobiales bacterium]|nr:hypothetical protein [Longimicrobiales bacterium]
MRRRPALLLVLAAIAVIAGAVTLAARGQERFPHDEHARLFPLCEGCHEGIAAGDAATSFPDPALCASCHDGTVAGRVTWTGPREHLTNLAFTHPAHVTAVAARDDQPLDCTQCHGRVGADRMTIVRADPPVCLACHGHTGTDHYLDAPCATCHVPYAESELPPSRIATLPRPVDHQEPGYILEGHGARAQDNVTRCAVCHTRERCEACHVNAAAVAPIAAMPRAPADWVLPRFAVEYPVPPSHRDDAWLEKHGPQAADGSCASCHTQESCTTCHLEPLPAAVEALPHRDRAAGVTTQRRMPRSHASRFFETQHAALAASQPGSCSTCHERTFCEDCHQAPASPSYHPNNFTLQHASAGWSRRMECATCHETRTFCRECHIQNGLEAQGRLNPGYHDAEPLWLLRHARAARQGLESCTACHTQKDCMQCHSELGAFKMSPHGPNFDARRAQKRNPLICFACHTTDPLARGA